MKILSIESSCDESSICLFDSKKGILAENINSQIDLHKLYGGVVPDLASRAHLKNFPLLFEDLFEKMKALGENLQDVDLISVTAGPGLANCLAMGQTYAKALGLFLNKKVVGANHLRAHAYSSFIPIHKENPENFEENLKNYLPHLGLIVSGGNTILFSINEEKDFEILGSCLDDAAGEAFDKGAKLLGFEYPGGAFIEKNAIQKNGNKKAFAFPRAMNASLNGKVAFSFSGLKTSLRYKIEKMTKEEITNQMGDLCASYQEAIVEQLVKKSKIFLDNNSFKSFGLTGGVSNNNRLCKSFENLLARKNIHFLLPLKLHSADNASMVAFNTFIDKKGQIEPPFTLMPNLKLC